MGMEYTDPLSARTSTVNLEAGCSWRPQGEDELESSENEIKGGASERARGSSQQTLVPAGRLPRVPKARRETSIRVKDENTAASIKRIREVSLGRR